MDLLEVFERGRQSEDQRDGRIYGFLEGIVTDVGGPVYGQVKARVGSQDSSVSSHWLDPAWPGGVEGVPRVNDPVFVAYVDGDPHRGIYLWHPSSKTKERASEFMALGTTMVGMFNFLVEQFNQLKTDFTNHVHTGPTTTCANGAAWTGSTAAPTGGTSALAANKGKASDGSVISNQTSSQIVLSGHAKVQK